jgi:hypothetical protein
MNLGLGLSCSFSGHGYAHLQTPAACSDAKAMHIAGGLSQALLISFHFHRLRGQGYEYLAVSEVHDGIAAAMSCDSQTHSKCRSVVTSLAKKTRPRNAVKSSARWRHP